MKRKRRTPTTSPGPEILLGKRYAEALRERAALLRTALLISKAGRCQIADDLEALAQIAETRPECFKGIK